MPETSTSTLTITTINDYLIGKYPEDPIQVESVYRVIGDKLKSYEVGKKAVM